MDADQVLWLSQTAKLAGQRPSHLAGISDEMDALAFDVTCAFRLEIYEIAKRRTEIEFLATMIAVKVGEMFSGIGEASDGETIIC